MTNECLFCNIVDNKEPAYRIWENDNYVAFLSIYPNTPGASVVIPKEHQPSDFFDLPKENIEPFMVATREVAKLLQSKLNDVGRVGLIFEGFDVDHLHAKLYPMHGTKDVSWRQRVSNVNKYFTHYEGYISSHKYDQVPTEDLVLIQQIITKEE